MQGDFAAESSTCRSRVSLGGGEAVVTIVMVIADGLFCRRARQPARCLTIQSSRAFLEADIVSHLLALNPLVTKNLGALGQKLLIEG